MLVRMEQVAVRVVAQDVIGTAGLTMLLRNHPRIVESPEPDVIVYAAPRVEEVARIRPLAGVPIVLLTGAVAEAALPDLIECGVVGIVDRGRADGAELADAVLAAASPKALRSKDLLGSLIGTTPAGLTEREVEVLRLLADGAETAEIARRLTYSESTIKHVLHTLSARCNFRNRVQAVAFALRSGVL
jgi:DNA-binding NarL/FixJ family response regulator